MNNTTKIAITAGAIIVTGGLVWLIMSKMKKPAAPAPAPVPTPQRLQMGYGSVTVDDLLNLPSMKALGITRADVDAAYKKPVTVDDILNLPSMKALGITRKDVEEAFPKPTTEINEYDYV